MVTRSTHVKAFARLPACDILESIGFSSLRSGDSWAIDLMVQPPSTYVVNTRAAGQLWIMLKGTHKSPNVHRPASL
jgi:hypothetical protein